MSQALNFHEALLDDGIQAKVAAVQQAAFSGLGPADWPYLLQTSRLLVLRDASPSDCAGQAGVLMSDQAAPRCWRARAGVYRAEALMRLGFEEQAKRVLTQAGRLLEDHPVEPADKLRGRPRCYEMLEALVAWNIAMGKINWGMVDSDNHPDFRTGSILCAGWPSSLSLSALDLKY